MNRPVYVFRCRECGRVVYPRRLACSSCRTSDWVEVEVIRGTVEEVTTRLHRTYEEKRNVIGGWTERLAVPLASVRTELGPVIIARLDAEVECGTAVRLLASSGGITAEPL